MKSMENNFEMKCEKKESVKNGFVFTDELLQ